MKQEPWIAPDAASNEEIIAAVQKCQSGALRYTIDNVENHDQVNEPGIFIAPNGPYVVSGCPDLEDTTWVEGATKHQYINKTCKKDALHSRCAVKYDLHGWWKCRYCIVTWM